MISTDCKVFSAVRAVCFDPDSTLLPTDRDVFLKAYMGGMEKQMMLLGSDPKPLIRVIWAGLQTEILR